MLGALGLPGQALTGQGCKLAGRTHEFHPQPGGKGTPDFGGSWNRGAQVPFSPLPESKFPAAPEAPGKGLRFELSPPESGTPQPLGGTAQRGFQPESDMVISSFTKIPSGFPVEENLEGVQVEAGSPLRRLQLWSRCVRVVP